MELPNVTTQELEELAESVCKNCGDRKSSYDLYCDNSEDEKKGIVICNCDTCGKHTETTTMLRWLINATRKSQGLKERKYDNRDNIYSE